MLEGPVNSVESLPIKLHDIVLFERGDVTVRLDEGAELCLRGHEVLYLIIFLQLVFCNQIIEIDKLTRHELLVQAQPVHLFLRLLHVALQVQFDFES